MNIENKLKGIVLAAGTGSRLYPATIGISKQLLPIHDKPMIYYPISTLMLAGIRQILIITTKDEQFLFKKLLGNGAQFGCEFTYAIQEKPNGLAEAYLLGESFLSESPSCLVLGDNIFFGHGFSGLLKKCCKDLIQNKGAIIFGYPVDNPDHFGVLECNRSGEVISIEEKPKNPKTNLAITGLYFYDENAPKLAKKITPSKRGELEITSLNQLYLEQKSLKAYVMGRGYAWLDTGTHENLMKASQFVSIVEKRQGLKIGCLEEIAYSKNWISKADILKSAKLYKNNYGEYLKKISKYNFDILNNDLEQIQ